MVTPPAQPPAPGTPGNPFRITDPRMMRAMAHPARIAIWHYLGLDGPATATECAKVVGISPSACSYHLRMLAQYGIVEEDLGAAADGRQRPWRVRIASFAAATDDSVPGLEAAGQLLAETLNASAEEILAQYRERYAEYPVEWREAAGASTDVLHVTPDELKTVLRRLTEVADEYRRLDPADRPPDARRIHVRLDLIPWFPPEEA